MISTFEAFSFCHVGKHYNFFRIKICEIKESLDILAVLKEARKGFFGCYSVCETMKDTKEGYFIV